MFKKVILLFFAFLCLISPVFADSKYNFNAFIADNANLLDNKAENSINAFLWDLQKKTGTDIAVVTVNSLDGRSVEETALNIGRKYKLGKKGKDNGAVVLVAPNERKMRIEIGYGLEGTITDGKAGRIRDEDMLPYFKKGDYQSGIWRGTYTLANAIAAAEGHTLSTAGNIPKAPASSEYDGYWFLLFVIIFLMLRFGIIPVPLYYGGYRSSGFSGGSFGGFGGGGGFGRHSFS